MDWIIYVNYNAMSNKPKLLISECLCGVPCRYDGKDNYIDTVEILKK